MSNQGEKYNAGQSDGYDKTDIPAPEEAFIIAQMQESQREESVREHRFPAAG